MTIRALAIGGALAAVAFSSPAFAVVCMNTDITPTAEACSGRYTGNLLNNAPANVVPQQTGLALIGFTWDGTNWNQFEKIDFSGSSINFDTLLVGTTYVGIHVGGGRGGGTTSFYRFDAGAGLDILTLNLQSGSDAVLYGTETPPPPVPEPVSWALMVGGFGMIGSMMRSGKTARVTVA